MAQFSWDCLSVYCGFWHYYSLSNNNLPPTPPLTSTLIRGTNY